MLNSCLHLDDEDWFNKIAQDKPADGIGHGKALSQTDEHTPTEGSDKYEELDEPTVVRLSKLLKCLTIYISFIIFVNFQWDWNTSKVTALRSIWYPMHQVFQITYPHN